MPSINQGTFGNLKYNKVLSYSVKEHGHHCGMIVIKIPCRFYPAAVPWERKGQTECHTRSRYPHGRPAQLLPSGQLHPCSASIAYGSW